MATHTRLRRSEPTQLRASDAANMLSQLAQQSSPGTRLGSRDELRQLCGVSVGSFHEALRLLQSTGEITVRTGPGGGIFVGQSTALSALIRSVNTPGGYNNDYTQIARVMRALDPLIIEDAIGALDRPDIHRLRERLDALRAARNASLRDTVRASLELFATIVAIPPPGVLTVVAGAILRTQISMLNRIASPIDTQWRRIIDDHIAAVTALIDAIIERDLDAAIMARVRPEFMGLFEALHDRAGV